MSSTVILQHSDTHPLMLLGMVLRASIFLDTSIDNFRVRSEDHLALSAHIKGANFGYDARRFPDAGMILGIVLNEDHRIAAQFIDCSIPADLLNAMRGNGLATSPTHLARFLGLDGIDPLVLR